MDAVILFDDEKDVKTLVQEHVDIQEKKVSI